MKKLLGLIPVLLILLSACGGGKAGTAKKLVVISSGKFKVSEADPRQIEFEPGGQHNEQELTFPDKDQVTITVKTAGTAQTYVINSDGTWLLNLKSDTVVGAWVNYGTVQKPAAVTSEDVLNMIDSTRQLMQGLNVSEVNRNYFLPPNTIRKISSNTAAILLSPYKLIPYKVELDEKGNAPEYYKFFTNSQKREALEDMLKRLSK